MKSISLAVPLALLSACEAPIESTFVDGSFGGTAFSSPSAISQKNDLGVETVLITDVADPCLHLRTVGAFEADGVNDRTGAHASALILTGSSQALLDPGGDGVPRLTAAEAMIDVRSRDKDGTLRGRFSASFGSPNRTPMTGEFVAPACKAYSTGCSVPGAALLPALALLVLARVGRRVTAPSRAAPSPSLCRPSA